MEVAREISESLFGVGVVSIKEASYAHLIEGKDVEFVEPSEQIRRVTELRAEKMTSGDRDFLVNVRTVEQISKVLGEMFKQAGLNEVQIKEKINTAFETGSVKVGDITYFVITPTHTGHADTVARNLGKGKQVLVGTDYGFRALDYGKNVRDGKAGNEKGPDKIDMVILDGHMRAKGQVLQSLGRVGRDAISLYSRTVFMSKEGVEGTLKEMSIFVEFAKQKGLTIDSSLAEIVKMYEQLAGEGKGQDFKALTERLISEGRQLEIIEVITRFNALQEKSEAVLFKISNELEVRLITRWLSLSFAEYENTAAGRIIKEYIDYMKEGRHRDKADLLSELSPLENPLSIMEKRFMNALGSVQHVLEMMVRNKTLMREAPDVWHGAKQRLQEIYEFKRNGGMKGVDITTSGMEVDSKRESFANTPEEGAVRHIARIVKDQARFIIPSRYKMTGRETAGKTVQVVQEAYTKAFKGLNVDVSKPEIQASISYLTELYVGLNGNTTGPNMQLMPIALSVAISNMDDNNASKPILLQLSSAISGQSDQYSLITAAESVVMGTGITTLQVLRLANPQMTEEQYKELTAQRQGDTGHQAVIGYIASELEKQGIVIDNNRLTQLFALMQRDKLIDMTNLTNARQSVSNLIYLLSQMNNLGISLNDVSDSEIVELAEKSRSKIKEELRLYRGWQLSARPKEAKTKFDKQLLAQYRRSEKLDKIMAKEQDIALAKTDIDRDAQEQTKDSELFRKVYGSRYFGWMRYPLTAGGRRHIWNIASRRDLASGYLDGRYRKGWIQIDTPKTSSILNETASEIKSIQDRREQDRRETLQRTAMIALIITAGAVLLTPAVAIAGTGAVIGGTGILASICGVLLSAGASMLSLMANPISIALSLLMPGVIKYVKEKIQEKKRDDAIARRDWKALQDMGKEKQSKWRGKINLGYQLLKLIEKTYKWQGKAREANKVNNLLTELSTVEDTETVVNSMLTRIELGRSLSGDEREKVKTGLRNILLMKRLGIDFENETANMGLVEMAKKFTGQDAILDYLEKMEVKKEVRDEVKRLIEVRKSEKGITVDDIDSIQDSNLKELISLSLKLGGDTLELDRATSVARTIEQVQGDKMDNAYIVFDATDKNGIKGDEGDEDLARVISARLNQAVSRDTARRMRVVYESMKVIGLNVAYSITLEELHKIAAIEDEKERIALYQKLLMDEGVNIPDSKKYGRLDNAQDLVISALWLVFGDSVTLGQLYAKLHKDKAGEFNRDMLRRQLEVLAHIAMPGADSEQLRKAVDYLFGFVNGFAENKESMRGIAEKYGVTMETPAAILINALAGKEEFKQMLTLKAKAHKTDDEIKAEREKARAEKRLEYLKKKAKDKKATAEDRYSLIKLLEEKHKKEKEKPAEAKPVAMPEMPQMPGRKQKAETESDKLEKELIEAVKAYIVNVPDTGAHYVEVMLVYCGILLEKGEDIGMVVYKLKDIISTLEKGGFTGLEVDTELTKGFIVRARELLVRADAKSKEKEENDTEKQRLYEKELIDNYMGYKDVGRLIADPNERVQRSAIFIRNLIGLKQYFSVYRYLGELSKLNGLSIESMLLIDQLKAEVIHVERMYVVSDGEKTRLSSGKEAIKVKRIIDRAQAVDGLDKKLVILRKGIMQYPESRELYVAHRMALLQADREIAEKNNHPMTVIDILRKLLELRKLDNNNTEVNSAIAELDSRVRGEYIDLSSDDEKIKFLNNEVIKEYNPEFVREERETLARKIIAGIDGLLEQPANVDNLSGIYDMIEQLGTLDRKISMGQEARLTERVQQVSNFGHVTSEKKLRNVIEMVKRYWPKVTGHWYNDKKDEKRRNDAALMNKIGAINGRIHEIVEQRQVSTEAGEKKRQRREERIRETKSIDSVKSVIAESISEVKDDVEKIKQLVNLWDTAQNDDVKAYIEREIVELIDGICRGTEDLTSRRENLTNISKIVAKIEHVTEIVEMRLKNLEDKIQENRHQVLGGYYDTYKERKDTRKETVQNDITNVLDKVNTEGMDKDTLGRVFRELISYIDWVQKSYKDDLNTNTISAVINVLYRIAMSPNADTNLKTVATKRISGLLKDNEGALKDEGAEFWDDMTAKITEIGGSIHDKEKADILSVLSEIGRMAVESAKNAEDKAEEGSEAKVEAKRRKESLKIQTADEELKGIVSSGKTDDETVKRLEGVLDAFKKMKEDGIAGAEEGARRAREAIQNVLMSRLIQKADDHNSRLKLGDTCKEAGEELDAVERYVGVIKRENDITKPDSQTAYKKLKELLAETKDIGVIDRVIRLFGEVDTLFDMEAKEGKLIVAMLNNGRVNVDAGKIEGVFREREQKLNMEEDRYKRQVAQDKIDRIRAVVTIGGMDTEEIARFDPNAQQMSERQKAKLCQMLAEEAFSEGDSDRGIKYLEAAIAIADGISKIELKLELSKRTKKDGEDVDTPETLTGTDAVLYEEYILYQQAKTGKESVETYIKIGDRYRENNDFEKAEEFYERAIKLGESKKKEEEPAQSKMPSFPGTETKPRVPSAIGRAYLGLAKIAEGEKDMEEAVEYHKRAVEADNKLAEAQEALGGYYGNRVKEEKNRKKRNEYHKNAIEAYQKSLEIYIEKKDIAGADRTRMELEGIGGRKAVKGAGEKVSVLRIENETKDVEELIKKEKYSEAIPKLEELLRTKGIKKEDQLKYRAKIIKAYYEIKNYEKVLEYCRQVLRGEPKNEDALRYMARAIKDKDLNKADDYYKRLLGVKADDPEALLWFAKKDFDEAKEAKVSKRALEQYFKGKLGPILETIEKILGKEPLNIEALELKKEIIEYKKTTEDRLLGERAENIREYDNQIKAIDERIAKAKAVKPLDDQSVESRVAQIEKEKVQDKAKDELITLLGKTEDDGIKLRILVLLGGDAVKYLDTTASLTVDSGNLEKVVAMLGNIEKELLGKGTIYQLEKVYGLLLKVKEIQQKLTTDEGKKVLTNTNNSLVKVVEQIQKLSTRRIGRAMLVNKINVLLNISTEYSKETVEKLYDVLKEIDARKDREELNSEVHGINEKLNDLNIVSKNVKEAEKALGEARKYSDSLAREAETSDNKKRLIERLSEQLSIARTKLREADSRQPNSPDLLILSAEVEILAENYDIAKDYIIRTMDLSKDVNMQCKAILLRLKIARIENDNSVEKDMLVRLMVMIEQNGIEGYNYAGLAYRLAELGIGDYKDKADKVVRYAELIQMYLERGETEEVQKVIKEAEGDGVSLEVLESYRGASHYDSGSGKYVRLIIDETLENQGNISEADDETIVVISRDVNLGRIQRYGRTQFDLGDLMSKAKKVSIRERLASAVKQKLVKAIQEDSKEGLRFAVGSAEELKSTLKDKDLDLEVKCSIAKAKGGIDGGIAECEQLVKDEKISNKQKAELYFTLAKRGDLTALIKGMVIENGKYADADILLMVAALDDDKTETYSYYHSERIRYLEQALSKAPKDMEVISQLHKLYKMKNVRGEKMQKLAMYALEANLSRMDESTEKEEKQKYAREVMVWAGRLSRSDRNNMGVVQMAGIISARRLVTKRYQVISRIETFFKHRALEGDLTAEQRFELAVANEDIEELEKCAGIRHLKVKACLALAKIYERKGERKDTENAQRKLEDIQEESIEGKIALAEFLVRREHIQSAISVYLSIDEKYIGRAKFIDLMIKALESAKVLPEEQNKIIVHLTKSIGSRKSHSAEWLYIERKVQLLPIVPPPAPTTLSAPTTPSTPKAPVAPSAPSAISTTPAAPGQVLEAAPGALRAVDAMSGIFGGKSGGLQSSVLAGGATLLTAIASLFDAIPYAHFIGALTAYVVVFIIAIIVVIAGLSKIFRVKKGGDVSSIAEDHAGVAEGDQDTIRNIMGLLAAEDAGAIGVQNEKVEENVGFIRFSKNNGRVDMHIRAKIELDEYEKAEVPLSILEKDLLRGKGGGREGIIDDVNDPGNKILLECIDATIERTAGLPEREKVKVIYEIVKNAFPYAHMRDTSGEWVYSGQVNNSKMTTAIAEENRGRDTPLGLFMKKGTGVCRHHVILFKKLAEAVGITTLEIKGHSTEDVSGRHAWTVVYYKDGTVRQSNFKGDTELWKEVSRKLIENNWAVSKDANTVELKVNLEEKKNDMLRVFGNEVFRILQQCQDKPECVDVYNELPIVKYKPDEKVQLRGKFEESILLPRIMSSRETGHKYEIGVERTPNKNYYRIIITGVPDRAMADKTIYVDRTISFNASGLKLEVSDDKLYDILLIKNADGDMGYQIRKQKKGELISAPTILLPTAREPGFVDGIPARREEFVSEDLRKVHVLERAVIFNIRKFKLEQIKQIVRKITDRGLLFLKEVTIDWNYPRNEEGAVISVPRMIKSIQDEIKEAIGEDVSNALLLQVIDEVLKERQGATLRGDGEIEQNKDGTLSDFSEVKAKAVDITKDYRRSLIKLVKSTDIDGAKKAEILERIKGIKEVKGIEAEIKGTDTFRLGRREANILYLTTDLLAYLAQIDQNEGTQFVLEYILHEILCEGIEGGKAKEEQGHYQAIAIQSKVFPRHYPLADKSVPESERKISGGDYKGRLQKHLRDFINLKIDIQNRVKEIITPNLIVGTVEKGFTGMTKGGVAVVSDRLSGEKIYRTAVHEGVHVWIAHLPQEKRDALKDSVISSVGVDSFFNALINAGNGHYGKYVQDELWEEVVAYVIENIGVSKDTDKPAQIQELGVEVVLDKDTVRLMDELGLFQTAEAVANDSRFNKGVKNFGRTETGKDVSLTKIDMREKILPEEIELRNKGYRMQKLQFNMESNLINELPPALLKNDVVFVADLPSCVTKEGKLTNKGQFIKNRIAYVYNSIPRDAEGKPTIKIGLSFVNIGNQRIDVKILNDLFGGIVGVITEDNIKEAVKEVQQTEVNLTAIISKQAADQVKMTAPQVVFVDSVDGWMRQLLNIIKTVTTNMVVRNAVIGLVDAKDIRFAFAESLALASALGTEAEKDVREFINKQVSAIANKVGIDPKQLMPKKEDSTGVVTVPDINKTMHTKTAEVSA
jgi:tetratricopeptide (TPR) repeat protein